MPSNRAGVTKSLSADLLSIVEAGLLAPSADNRHCFEVCGSPDCISLLGNDLYGQAPYHRKILNLIALGAVAENMAVRAAGLGYRMDATWLPDPGQPSLIARLRLTKCTPVETALDAAIAKRLTNRRLIFHGPALNEARLSRFTQYVVPIKGVKLSFFDAGRQRAKLLRLLAIAEAERFNSEALHKDLFSSVRFDVGWHASAEEGLPPAVLGIEPGMRWAFAQLRHWPLMNLLRHIGLHRALAFRAAYLPCRLAPHIGVLTTSSPIAQGAVSVGSALQRIWLLAESEGLALQPFAGPALLALPEYRDVPERTAVRLREGWKDLTEDTPLMTFRLGRAARPSMRTGRPPIDNCFGS